MSNQEAEGMISDVFDIGEARAKFAETLAGLKLVHGVGEAGDGTACTESALQLALTGRLTDDLHPCVDPAVHRWVIRTQDRLDEATLNGPWKELAPRIVGTAGLPDRLGKIMETMWDALASLTFKDAEANAAWQKMLELRTKEACLTARQAVSCRLSLTKLDFDAWAVRSLEAITAP